MVSVKVVLVGVPRTVLGGKHVRMVVVVVVLAVLEIVIVLMVKDVTMAPVKVVLLLLVINVTIPQTLQSQGQFVEIT
jgi:hypothetical protein